MTFIFRRLALSIALAALVATQMLHIAVPRTGHNRDHPGVDALSPTPTIPRKDNHHGRGLDLHSKQKTTNAQRFAAGLPPLKPRNLFSPSKVLRSRSSASPSASAGLSARSRRALTTRATMRTGFVQVVDTRNQKTLGYVSRTFTADGQYLVSRDFSRALEVAFDPTHVESKFSHIRVVIPQDEEYPFLGLIAETANGVSTNGIKADGQNLPCLGMTPKERLPSSHKLMANNREITSGDVETTETAIWIINSPSAIPAWINPDGSTANAALTYFQRNGTLCLVSGTDSNADDGLSVKLRLVLDT
ncbi:hypothetical protein FRB95_007509 [Tulasnella sp. JGI-2019a]|nr:hypothetical protein FRB93_011906 [Tulasnella sp. JGI-2019a]KAG9036946.1 hypothetical protein FRB95_007509 [Tulasnella sp. JGI-2019a]